MEASPGLRERKKQRTREAIADAAISMFLEAGFDHVSCADVAARAEVSKPTLFKYFPTKEDLVLHRISDHEDEAARVVRERPSGESALTALQRHFMAGLAARDPITGLNDAPHVMALYRMIENTPDLSVRLLRFTTRRADALAEALSADRGGDPGDITPRVVAHQVISTLRVLADDNLRRLGEGRTPGEVYPEAVAAAERAFDILRNGIDDAY